MKIVFVPQLFYFSIVFSIIFSIYLYIEQDNNKFIKDIDESGNKNIKYIEFGVYLFIIFFCIFMLSFRIWMFDMYFSPRILMTAFFLFIILLYYIYTKI
jgi:hypothetical protein